MPHLNDLNKLLWFIIILFFSLFFYADLHLIILSNSNIRNKKINIPWGDICYEGAPLHVTWYGKLILLRQELSINLFHLSVNLIMNTLFLLIFLFFIFSFTYPFTYLLIFLISYLLTFISMPDLLLAWLLAPLLLSILQFINFLSYSLWHSIISSSLFDHLFVSS